MAKYTFVGSSNSSNSKETSESTNNLSQDFGILSQSLSKFNTMFNSMITNISKGQLPAVTEKVANSLNRFNNAVNKTVNTLYDKTVEVNNRINTSVSNFFKNFKFLANNAVTRWLDDVYSKTSSFFKKVGQSVNGNKIVQMFDNVAQRIGGTLQDGLSMIFGDGLFGRAISSAVSKSVTSAMKIIVRASVFIFKFIASIPKLVAKSVLLGKILVIALIVAGLALIGVLIYNNIRKVWNWIKNLGQSIWDWMKDLWKGIKEGFVDFFRGIWDGFKNSWLGRKLGLSDEEDDEHNSGFDLDLIGKGTTAVLDAITKDLADTVNSYEKGKNDNKTTSTNSFTLNSNVGNTTNNTKNSSNNSSFNLSNTTPQGLSLVTTNAG